MRATLAGVELPFAFKYDIPELTSEMTIQRTCGGVVIQEAGVGSILPGKLISWKLPLGTPEEYKTMYDFHQSREDRVFIGYWGEVYTVRSFALGGFGVTSRIFPSSGSWVIKCVHTEIDPRCNAADQVQGTAPPE